MEVDQSHFRKQLLSILNDISKATFISFDLEMSGIHRNNKYDKAGRIAGGHDNGKPSLQQLYDETRIAAETYQVLQVGITCIEEDREKGYYLARPYNFNLSPLFYQDTRIKERFPERKIVFSSSATDFLQCEGFNIGKVFCEGVFYLSHAEEEETRERFRLRAEHDAKKSNVIIPPGDTATLEFYRNARKIISAWVNNPEPEHDFVNIGDEKGALNGYQRLLVHQLVKTEFPGHRSFARNKQSFIQIEKLNPKKEAEFQAGRLNEFNYAIARQIGLRWIFEALTGGDLEDIPVVWFCVENDDHPELSQTVLEPKFKEVKEALKTKETVLIGHNLFTDLVCLYKTFVGPLPLLVEEFQDRIRGLFPTIIDTKYLATQGCDAMNPAMRQSLSELLEPFKKIHTPFILLEEKHTAYGSTLGKKHEAGFDSWMTAELFIKLAAKLYNERKHLLENFSSESDSDSNPGYRTSTSISGDDETGGVRLASGSSEERNTEGLMDVSNMTSMEDHLPPEWHAKKIQKLTLNPNNPYSILDDLGEDLPTKDQSETRQWVPLMTNSFWDMYTNKLRVNASEGGVCYLDGDFN